MPKSLKDERCVYQVHDGDNVWYLCVEGMRSMGYRCGEIDTVRPSDLRYLTTEQMFWANSSLLF